MPKPWLTWIVAPVLVVLTSCAVQPPAPIPPSPPPSQPCPVCPPPPTPPKPAAKPLQESSWVELPGWGSDDLSGVLAPFLLSCHRLKNKSGWQEVCAGAAEQNPNDGPALRAWFEANFQPWQLVNPDGGRQGLITGYYEPILQGSRTQKPPYLYPILAPPADLIDVELGGLYPELKNMRLRGRLEGRRLLPYYSRGEWQAMRRADAVLAWVDDEIDLFFMQIQGSGQLELEDGSRVRMAYADQNGHPYRSIGRWLIERGELTAGNASMEGIRAWAEAHPERRQELLNVNPSMVFFRELPVRGAGPPGALGEALTPERSIAVDPRTVTLGAPIWLSTTYPLSQQPLQRLVMAQDTGGAIRGVVRADFFWGTGRQAGAQAGKMRSQGAMWLLLPKGMTAN